MINTEFRAPPDTPEVYYKRIIHAPRELVFRTVIDPLKIPDWWGPSRLKTQVINMIVMRGGSWRFLQRDQEGKEFGFHGVYHDVVIPERLVYTSEFEGTPGNVALYTDTFEEHEGKTIINTRVTFQSVEDRDQKLKWGMEDGINAMTNRLNELLEKQLMHERRSVMMLENMNDSGCITITRVFDAPREQIWERWTDPNDYMCWWGPKDFTSPTANLDVREGGKFLVSMRAPDGKEYWDTGIYEEVIEKNRLVYRDSFADEHGNIVPASYYGMGSDEPLDMEIEVTLEEDGGKTRMTLEHCGLLKGDMLDNARLGWMQSLDKLEDCLS
jgi:uncharacterized protein YndB with AHSA1/START domain